MPTRAEVTDIAHIVHTGADAALLTGETAAGAHPHLALAALTRVLNATEATHPQLTEVSIRSKRDAFAESAVQLADSSAASAILVITRSGLGARELSRFRGQCPILACCTDASVERSLLLSYGITPLVLSSFADDPEETVNAALEHAKQTGHLASGDSVVLITDTKATNGNVSSVQVRTA